MFAEITIPTRALNGQQSLTARLGRYVLAVHAPITARTPALMAAGNAPGMVIRLAVIMDQTIALPGLLLLTVQQARPAQMEPVYLLAHRQPAQP